MWPAVVYLPEREGQDLTAPMLERSFAVTAIRRASPSRGHREFPRSPVSTSGRWQADVLHTRLPGADLLVRRKTGVPLVTLGIYVPRLELDPPAQAGLGALVVRSSVRAAGGLDAGELAFAFERLGGTLSPTAASDWLGFSTTVLSENLAEAATLLDDGVHAAHSG